MGTIYREASIVLIELGPDQEGDSKIFKDDIAMLGNLIPSPFPKGLTLREVLDLPLKPGVEDRLAVHDFSA